MEVLKKDGAMTQDLESFSKKIETFSAKHLQVPKKNATFAEHSS